MTAKQSGWTIGEWCAEPETGFSRQTYWRLPDDRKPIQARIGGIVRIVESPAAWLKRMAETGPVEMRKYTEKAAA